jgi:hypothetical protein
MLHEKTFEYLKPTEEQQKEMKILREAAMTYADILENLVPDGPDKTYVLRAHRQNAMWANVAVVRYPDGTPREENTECEKKAYSVAPIDIQAHYPMWSITEPKVPSPPDKLSVAIEVLSSNVNQCSEAYKRASKIVLEAMQ